MIPRSLVLFTLLIALTSSTSALAQDSAAPALVPVEPAPVVVPPPPPPAVAAPAPYAPPPAHTPPPPAGDPEAADRHDDLLPLRVILEPIVGYSIGFAGGIIGTLIGLGAGCSVSAGGTVDALGCAAAILAGWTAGTTFLTPLGTSLVGMLAHGRGDYGVALVGSLAGSAVQFASTMLVGATTRDIGAVQTIFWFTSALPAIGAMLVYELFSGARNDALRHGESASIVPVVSPALDAQGAVVGATLGVGGTF